MHDDELPTPAEVPVFMQAVCLPVWRTPDWDAAHGAIGRVDRGDVDHIEFALGITTDAHDGDEDRVVQAAQHALSFDLLALRDAIERPQAHGVHVIATRSDLVYVAVAVGWDEDPRGPYGSIMRLGLMYVLNAAGFRHSSEMPSPGAPPRTVRCRPGRSRAPGSGARRDLH